MAGKGPPPKPPGTRRRRPSKAEELPQEVLTAPPVAVPTLPGMMSYSSSTRRWWRTWVTSPQSTRFAATDFQRLAMLAPLVDAYFAEPDKALLAEIRINESALGACVSDRARLRWALEVPPAVEAPKTEDGGVRKAQILKMVDRRD